MRLHRWQSKNGLCPTDSLYESYREPNMTSDMSHELQDALAAIIANTKRVNRRLNLIEIARKISIARKYLSLNELSERIMLSKEMIREFQKVNQLSSPVRLLILRGKIRSVEIANRLSRLPIADQLYTAKEIVKGDLNSEDLRAIVSLKRSDPSLDISSVIQRIKESRNIKEFIAEFNIPKSLYIQQELINKRLERIFGPNHVRLQSFQGGVVTIILDSKAKETLVKKARDCGVTKREYLQLVVSTAGKINTK